jgi:hypothetical protein
MAKKNTAETPVTPTNEWKTLHIFGYGETKLINEVQSGNQNLLAGGEVNDFSINEKKALTSTLTKAQAIIDFVYGKKPADSDAGVEFHAITIVRNVYGMYVPKNVNEKVFRIEYKDMDATLIQDLVSELQAIA